MPRVVHFEIPADDPERAVAFYKKVFGWTADKWAGPMDYWLVTTGPSEEPGIDGAIHRRESPQQSVTNTVCVDSIDKTVDDVVSAGGQVVMQKHPIPGVGYFALFQDTEGNLFGTMQPDPSVT